MSAEPQQGGSGVLGAVASIVKSVAPLVGMIGSRARAARDRLPRWLSPADFKDENKAADFILIGGGIVLVLILVAFISISRRAK